MIGSLQAASGAAWRALTGRKAYDIGLQIGLERLNLMQLQPGAGRPTVLAAASISHRTSREELMANPARLKALFRKACAEQPFRGRRVVTCLPSDLVKMLQLNYTVADGAPESEAVIAVLRERVHEELDGMIVDYIPVRQEIASRPKEAIVAMAPRAKVVAYLDVLGQAGLEVASIDVAAAALARLMSWIGTAGTGAVPNLLLINFGSLCTYLTVVWGRRLTLDRPVEFGEQRLLSRLKSILDIAQADGKRLLLEHGFGPRPGDAGGEELGQTLREVLRPEFATLTAEVNNTLIYTASRTHGRTVDAIYVVGGIARYPGIEQFLREQFSLPLRVLDPCAMFEHKLTDGALSWLPMRSGVAAATGLALRGVPGQWPTLT